MIISAFHPVLIQENSITVRTQSRATKLIHHRAHSLFTTRCPYKTRCYRASISYLLPLPADKHLIRCVPRTNEISTEFRENSYLSRCFMIDPIAVIDSANHITMNADKALWSIVPAAARRGRWHRHRHHRSHPRLHRRRCCRCRAS